MSAAEKKSQRADGGPNRTAHRARSGVETADTPFGLETDDQRSIINADY